MNMDEHIIPLEELYKRLNVDPKQGLSESEVQSRNEKYGDNTLNLKQTKKVPLYLQILKQFTVSIFVLVGSFLYLGLYFFKSDDSPTLPSCIGLLIFGLLSAFLNYEANLGSDNTKNIGESMMNFVPFRAKVIRGSMTYVEAKKLVPGDIIEFSAGDRIPADARIISSQNVKVDLTAIIGDPEHFSRTEECTSSNPFETQNLVFLGTFVKEGKGRAIVIKTGDNTVTGQMAKLACEPKLTPGKLKTPSFIVKVSYCIAIAISIISLIQGNLDIYRQSFIFGIILLTLEQGVMLFATLTQVLSALKLTKSGFLTKNLNAIEKLAHVSCIIADKTGTLSQNRMTVENIWYGGKTAKADNYQKIGSGAEYNIESPGFKALHESAILASEAIFYNDIPFHLLSGLEGTEEEIKKKRQIIEENSQKELSRQPWLQRRTIGDASESALIRFFQPFEDITQTRGKYPIKRMKDRSMAKIPFQSFNKYSLSICDYKTEDSANCIFVLGAAERVWSLCSHILINDKTHAIDENWKQEFEKVKSSFTSAGEKFLGFAKLHLSKREYPEDYQFNCRNLQEINFPIKGLVFTGLISLFDPPRMEIPFSVAKCKASGIKVVMTTGEDLNSSISFAKKAQIFDKTELTANQLAEKKKISLSEALNESNYVAILVTY